MSGRDLPWSWTAVAISGVPLGVLMVGGLIFVSSFRTGLDADLNHLIAQSKPLDLMSGSLMLGAGGLVFVVLAWWLARVFHRPKRMFLILTPLIPASVITAFKVFSIASWATDDLNGRIMPFEQDLLFYLPNYLEVLAVAAAFLVAAWTYVAVAQSVRGRL